MTNETFDPAAQRREPGAERDGERGDERGAEPGRERRAEPGVDESAASQPTASPAHGGATATPASGVRERSTTPVSPSPADTTPASPAAPAVEPTRIALDPKLDQHQRQGFTGATWIALILGTVVLVLLLVFILQNNVPAQFAYFGWQFGLPLGIAMLFAAIAGVLITALLGSVRMFKLGRRVRHLEKERESIKRAMR